MKIYEQMAYLKTQTSTKKALVFLNEYQESHPYIKYLLNPYVRTGLGGFELIGSPRGVGDADELSNELLDYFSNCGKNGGRVNKESFAMKIFLQGPDNPDWKWFVELIATHGHTAFGVGQNTARKAGIDIPGFGCQLGVKSSDIDNPEAWLQETNGRMQRWRISEKIDGTRRLFVKKDGQIECFSRSGREDGTLMHINATFNSDIFPDNRIYDCEIVDKEVFGKVESFKVRAQSIGKASRKGGDKTSLIAICFDYYDFGQPELTTLNRTRGLIDIFDKVSPSSPVRLVRMLGRMDGYQQEKLQTILDQVLSEGGEGLMIQELSSKYVFERTQNLIKLKRLEEFKGHIVGRTIGRPGTRLEGKVAAIVCQVDGCTKWVSVGSGLNNAYIDIFTEHYRELEGAEVELEAFGRTTNKTGMTSLCFPVFKRCKHKLFERFE